MRRIVRTTSAAAGAVLTAGAWWAFSPPPDLPPLPALQPTPAPSERPPGEDRTFDLNVFAARLWNPPQAPAETVAETPQPPKPLNLQLIGIIHEGTDVRSAAVYDVDSDRLFILSNGDQIRGQTVQSITAQGIELTDGRFTQRLMLKQETS